MDGPITYPVVLFIVRHGRRLTAIIGVLMLVGSVVATSLVAHWGWAIAAGLGASLVWGLLRSYVEVVQIVADTLLPR